MATLAARAIRGARAREELSAELDALSQWFGVTLPEMPARSADPELQPILETEWQRDVARAMREATGARPDEDLPAAAPRTQAKAKKPAAKGAA